MLRRAKEDIIVMRRQAPDLVFGRGKAAKNPRGGEFARAESARGIGGIGRELVVHERLAGLVFLRLAQSNAGKGQLGKVRQARQRGEAGCGRY